MTSTAGLQQMAWSPWICRPSHHVSHHVRSHGCHGCHGPTWPTLTSRAPWRIWKSARASRPGLSRTVSRSVSICLEDPGPKDTENLRVDWTILDPLGWFDATDVLSTHTLLISTQYSIPGYSWIWRDCMARFPDGFQMFQAKEHKELPERPPS